MSLLALSTVVMSGCSCKASGPNSDSSNNSGNTSESGSGSHSSEMSEVPTGTDVTVYLDLGSIGLYKGQKGQDIPEKFLENAIAFQGKAGETALPGASDVTSTSGATFVSWVYYAGGGAPTAYDKVPLYDGIVLLANFTGGNGGGGGGGTSQQTGDVTYTVTSLPDWIQNDGCVIFAWAWSANDAGSWHSLSYGGSSDASFTVNEELTGFLLARCAAGTTTPNWNQSEHSAGRVYNKTSDIACTSGTYSYVCSNWVEYNP